MQVLMLCSPNHQPESFLQSTSWEGLALVFDTLQEGLGKHQGSALPPGIEAWVPPPGSRDEQA